MHPLTISEAKLVTVEDHELFRRIRGDDREALAMVYRRHAPTLLGMAERLCGSRPEAEDVVHDVFVGLPEALGRYREQGKAAAWLRKLTVRRALTQLRHRGRELQLVAPESTTDRMLDRAALRIAIDTLPDKLRLVFVLHAVEGYTHKEISECLGIRKGTSEVRLHRAMRALRTQLEEV